MRTTLFNKKGDYIVVPSDKVEYLQGKGWSSDQPKAKRKPKSEAQIDEETE